MGRGATPGEGGRAAEGGGIPAWLSRPEGYVPTRDRDGFLAKSVLSMASVLERFRLDDGESWAGSPSAVAKLAIALAVVVMTSLARNFFFVTVVLAVVLARMALLPTGKLVRVVRTAALAAGLTLLVMVPAVLVGQSRSPVTVTAKVLASTCVVMTATVTTAPFELAGALRWLRVPDVVVLTLDLAVRSIHDLGQVALEVLTALRLRSVGRNRDKRGSLGGVGGVVLLKSADAARQTYDAMRCRGFEGEYAVPRGHALRPLDAAWAAGLALLALLFVYLEGLV